VNGRDVSGSSHEEAVKAFMDAEEPIVVEVRRRKAGEDDDDGKGESLAKGEAAATSSEASSKRSSAYCPKVIVADETPSASGDVLLPDLHYEVSCGARFSSRLYFHDHGCGSDRVYVAGDDMAAAPRPRAFSCPNILSVFSPPAHRGSLDR